MRIISGKYKGSLVNFKADHIRPTTDRVKESLFNILMGEFEQTRVLDLFSGTGNLGIEALSRGARELVIVEKNRKSIEIIKSNLQRLKVSEPVEFHAQDVLLFLKKYEGPGFDVIFADPPFTEEMADDVMKAAATSQIFLPHSVMSIESTRREILRESYDPLIQVDQRPFGDKILSFFRLKDSSI